MDSKLLTDVIAFITEKVATVERSHMLKPWEMVFGGLVLPLLAEMDESIKDDPQYAEVVARYGKDEVEKFFAPKTETVEKVRVERVETVKVIEKIIGGAGMTRMPTLHATVKDGGKFRRLKETVAKASNKKNDIPPSGLDAINIWWNRNQKLTAAGDCQPVADEINGWNVCLPLSAAQVSGWFSWLCQLATKMEPDRNSYIVKALGRGKFTVVPVFSYRFREEIANNRLAKKQDREVAARARKQMEAEKSAALAGGTVVTV